MKEMRERKTWIQPEFEFYEGIDQEIPDEFSEEHIAENLKYKDVVVAESGREYRKKGGEIYYNSSPDKNNVWGNLEQDKAYFFIDGKFYEKTKNAYQLGLSDQTKSQGVYAYPEVGFVVNEKGYKLEPNNNGVHEHDSGAYFILENELLEKCDKTGKTKEKYLEEIQETVSDIGYKWSKYSYMDNYQVTLKGEYVLTKNDGDSIALKPTIKDGLFVLETNDGTTLGNSSEVVYFLQKHENNSGTNGAGQKTNESQTDVELPADADFKNQQTDKQTAPFDLEGKIDNAEKSEEEKPEQENEQ